MLSDCKFAFSLKKPEHSEVTLELLKSIKLEVEQLKDLKQLLKLLIDEPSFSEAKILLKKKVGLNDELKLNLKKSA